MARVLARLGAILLALVSWGALLPPVGAATERWLEVRSPHFVVVSNAGDKQARQVAEQFETFRAVFQTALPNARVDPGQPVVILAVNNEKSLQQLIPEYWEHKGSVRPSGVFLAGPDKHYVALRVNAEQEDRFHVIYHEYVHLLVRLNLEVVPLWLDEGLAEFYANATIFGKDVGLGRPSQSDLELLTASRLLPLDALLAADHSSPLYNEANRATIFYAQSWALTHYLMFDNGKGHRKELADFLTLVQQGVGTVEAFRRVFGELKQFQKTMDAYIRQQSFFYGRMKVPLDIDPNSFAARELAPAESATLRGDFHVHANHLAAAQPLLEEAIRLDASLAAPRESMGLLYSRQGNRAEAVRWFTEAVRLDSKNFLAHYFYAVLSSEGAVTPEQIASAEKALRSAVELNSNFAPAYSTLAQLLMIRGENLQEALSLAQRAIQLEPGTLTNHLTLAQVYLRMEKFDEAQKLAQRVLAAANSPADHDAAAQFLEFARAYQAQLAAGNRSGEAHRQAEEEKEIGQPETPSKETARPASVERIQPEPPPAAPPARKQRVPGEGRVTALSCKGAVLDLTLEYYGFKLRLHSDDYSKIEFMAGSQVQKVSDPCSALKGREVRIEYAAVVGMPYAGEILSVEFQ